MSKELQEEIKLSQVLNINLAETLAHMPEKELAYLQIVPPSWMLNNDPLIEQINHLGKLYSEGRLVWAAIVQANKFLFDEDKAFSCPADIVYDPTGHTPSYQLINVASQLYALKHTTPDDPELRRYAEHVTDEQERHIQRVPSALSALPLITTGIFLWRPHLPNGKLSMNIIPILVHDDCEGIVTMLPARFWEGSYLYQQWLYYGDNDIETSPAFYQLNANGQYWQSFRKQVRPTKEELPGFANQPKPYHSKKATAASLAFISQCLEMVKLDYKENVQGRGLLAKPNHLLSLIILFAVVVGVLLAIQKVLS